MEEAIRLSHESMESGDGSPFGAVIVRNGTVIGNGRNRVQAHCDPTAHAEVDAIRDACRRLKATELPDSEIYCSGEPCPMCLSAIYWSGIGKVYYANTRLQAAEAGFDDALLYAELQKAPASRAIPCLHITGTDASAAFARWKELQKT